MEILTQNEAMAGVATAVMFIVSKFMNGFWRGAFFALIYMYGIIGLIALARDVFGI